MSSALATADVPVLERPFMKLLVSLIRAEDTYGAWEAKKDEELLGPFVMTKEQRREIPIIGDPDPDVLTRIEQFYKAVGLAVEKRCGLVASPIMKMSHEGFGRMVLLTGRLVVVSRHLRDVHRYGYPTLETLAEEGEKVVDSAVELIQANRALAEG